MLTDPNGDGYLQIRGIGHREISFEINDLTGEVFFDLLTASGCIYRLEARSSCMETGLTKFALIPDNGFVKVLKRGEE
jgi:hypothetical protein